MEDHQEASGVLESGVQRGVQCISQAVWLRLAAEVWEAFQVHLAKPVLGSVDQLEVASPTLHPYSVCTP